MQIFVFTVRYFLLVLFNHRRQSTLLTVGQMSVRSAVATGGRPAKCRQKGNISSIRITVRALLRVAERCSASGSRCGDVVVVVVIGGKRKSRRGCEAAGRGEAKGLTRRGGLALNRPRAEGGLGRSTRQCVNGSVTRPCNICIDERRPRDRWDEPPCVLDKADMPLMSRQ